MLTVQRFGEARESLPAHQNGFSSILPRTVVAVVDDDESTRRSLVRSIEGAGYKTEAFASAAEFLENLLPEAVSCVVCDLLMPGLSGLALQESLRSRVPFLSVIFITGHGDISAGVTAMKAGAVDFFEKPLRRDALLDAIRSAVERTDRMRTAGAELCEVKKRYDRLTPREREVLALVSAGLMNKQVAAQLGAAEKTVKQHRGNIMRKMEAESLADLVMMADRLGVRPANTDFSRAKGRLLASLVMNPS
jgi:FixJ family two-component response regulator